MPLEDGKLTMTRRGLGGVAWHEQPRHEECYCWSCNKAGEQWCSEVFVALDGVSDSESDRGVLRPRSTSHVVTVVTTPFDAPDRWEV